jgi:hypothetical protein
MRAPQAHRWCRWLRAAGLPAAHIASVLDLDELQVHSHLAAECKAPLPIPPRWVCERDARGPLRRHTELKVRVLEGLGYDAARIAEALCVQPRLITSMVARVRTRREQASVDAVRRCRVRAKRAMVAAYRAAWGRRDARRDDDGCKAPGADIAPPAAELLIQVVELEPPPSPVPMRWHQTTDERVRRGENSGRSKLTWEAVREARQMHADGKSMYELAWLFDVSRGAMAAVIKRRTWVEVEAPDAQAPPVEAPPAEPPVPKPRAQRHRWRADSRRPTSALDDDLVS